MEAEPDEKKLFCLNCNGALFEQTIKETWGYKVISQNERREFSG